MCEGQVGKRHTDRELLLRVQDDLDALEAHLKMLAWPNKSEAAGLILQMRQKIIEEFAQVEHGAEPEGEAS